MSQSHSVYDLIVRDADDKIVETRKGLGRTDATEFLRSLLRGMDYDEVMVQIQKRIPA
jgi:hypothetical protein